MFFALHVTFPVSCIWPVSEGRREFGELTAGKELDFVCETGTQLLLCGLNSGPDKDVSQMKAVVAAENTEQTAGFLSHSDSCCPCVVKVILHHRPKRQTKMWMHNMADLHDLTRAMPSHFRQHALQFWLVVWNIFIPFSWEFQ